MIRGKVVIDANHQFEYSSENGTDFKDSKGTELTKEDLEEWALILNSPWSQTNETYTIEVNCKDSYTKMEEGTPIWRCIYKVVGYEYITATCIGYGNTEEEALMECKNLFKYLQKQYNPNNESI